MHNLPDAGLPAGQGLVPFRTTVPPLESQALDLDFKPAVGVDPSRPGAIEIDQKAMRLRRLKKNVLTSARFHSKASGYKDKPVMVTLTYRDDAEWQPEQIANYLRTVRKWQARKRPGTSFRYVWVFETTKRGRPHYHVLFWVPRGLTMPRADKQRWWTQGLTRTEVARDAVGYIAKYASKGADDNIPKGVRLYGVGGLSANHRQIRAWWNLPTYVRHWGFPVDRWRRAPGGGWCRRTTGELRPSQWSVEFVLGRVFASRIPSPIPILWYESGHKWAVGF